MSLVSHSEVDSFLSCERKHFYAHGHKVEPKNLSDSLLRGTVCHSVFEAFFSKYTGPRSHDDAVKYAMERLDAIGMEPDKMGRYQVFMDAHRIMPQWFEWWKAFNCTGRYVVFAVEHEYRLDIPGVGTYPFKPDLILIDTQDNNNLYLVDHKIVYNFYNQDDVNLMPQLPKYTGALRAKGIHITGSIYNQVRWRENAKGSIVSWIDFKPSNDRIKRSFYEQIRATERIANLKSLPFEEWDDKALRSMNSFNCKNCGFKPACTAELNGSNISLMLQTDYQPNTYGYKEESE